MTYTFDEAVVSDLHKDARGFRPSELFWEEWSQCGADNRQAMWDSLCNELTDELDRERRAQAAAAHLFQQQIEKNLALGAQDRVTAIRWILEGEDFTEFDLAYGADYVAFHFDLSYQNPFVCEIQDAIASMQLDLAQLYEDAVSG